MVAKKFFEKTPNEPKTYFKIGNMFYLYKNIKYAALAYHKLTKQNIDYIEDGLLEIRDETPIKEKDFSDLYVVSAKEKNDVQVIHNKLSNIAAINIYDGGMFSSRVEDNTYYSAVYDKNGKQVFTTNNPFDDNGLGAPYISEYDLPAKVVVNYRRSAYR